MAQGRFLLGIWGCLVVRLWSNESVAEHRLVGSGQSPAIEFLGPQQSSLEDQAVPSWRVAAVDLDMFPEPFRMLLRQQAR